MHWLQQITASRTETVFCSLWGGPTGGQASRKDSVQCRARGVFPEVHALPEPALLESVGAGAGAGAGAGRWESSE